MLLSLHLGYHFTTFEAMCTPDPSKNYIRMQFKGGGASADRRARRIGLVMDLLSRAGFEHASRPLRHGELIRYLEALAASEAAGTLEVTRGLRTQLRMLTQDSDDDVAEAAEELRARVVARYGQAEGSRRP